ncbi:transcription factor MYB1, putative [Plasmodium malariae]|uniref:Transcription factor MYB1, putative n=1 Tax=Plasmodium malariae TaxID=5858 RepID=A0A1C3L299_PLAMA|nr:transcription factor MYB1, putative [Plasmodium malariae]
MEGEKEEFENLSELEGKLQTQLDIVEKLISITKDNIEKLNEYINKKYNEIKTLASKKPTRINWDKAENRTHMSLFYNKDIGFAPSNDDALKLLQFQSMFSNYRKKYEYKKNEWTKKDIDLLFNTVEHISKKYALHYLIDPELSYEVKEQKRKEIEEERDAKNILTKIKLYFDEKEKLATITDDCDCAHSYCEEGKAVNGQENDLAANRIANGLAKNTNANSFAMFSKDFWNLVSDSLKNVQNARECQKTWLYYGCFEDDKQKKWSKEELNKLLLLSKKYNEREWKTIARELNTNRSPLSCFEQYIKINKLYDTSEKKVKLERIAFNALEDIQLQILVSIIGDKNWSDVKKHMESLYSNIKRIQTRKKNSTGENEKHKKFLNDEISYKRRYLRLAKSRKGNE